jgi:hypothetical protein
MEISIDAGNIYLDPDYKNTSAGYGHTINPIEFVQHTGRAVWISESIPLSTKAFCVSKPRQKGGINGAGRKIAHTEWLSLVEPDLNT